MVESGETSSQLRLLLAAWLGGLALTESVAETTAHQLQVARTAGAGGLPALGLLRPVVAADFGSRIAALAACRLLNVVRGASTTTAQGVRLIVPLTK